MTHVELVNYSLAVHGPLLIVAIAAYYKYGDRSDVFAKSLQGTDGLQKQIKIRLTDELRSTVASSLGEPNSVSSRIVNPDGQSYVESPVDRTHSERFWECIKDYVGQQAGALADYCLLREKKNVWKRWSQRLSWAILGLLVWQLIAVGALGLLDKLVGFSVPDFIVKLMALPTGGLVLACLVPLPCILLSHDAIIELRDRYDAV